MLNTLKLAVKSIGVLSFSLLAFSTSPAALAEGLSFDNEHDLVVLRNCKLAVRYNNKTFVPVKVAKFSPEEGYFMDAVPVKSFQIKEDYSANMKGNTKGERIIVECYKVGKLGRVSKGRLKKEFTKNNKVKEINLTYDRIAKETGATKTGLGSLRSVDVFEVRPGDGSQKYRLFAFQYDKILTLYARRMRPNTLGFDDAAPVIVSQLSFQLEPDLEGNVKVE